MADMTIEQMIASFRLHYSGRMPDLCPKFSVKLGPEMEMRARLMASYDVNVGQCGGSVVWDEMTELSIAAVTAWMFDDTKRWLLLYGSLGNGKSTMLKSIKTIFRSSYLFSAQAIYEDFKYNERLPDIPDNKMLIIDDVGAEPVQCKIFGEERVPLVDLLLHRYAVRATTIIATNLTIDEMQARYGDRLADRMAEMATAILYDAPSYRGR